MNVKARQKVKTLQSQRKIQRKKAVAQAMNGEATDFLCWNFSAMPNNSNGLLGKKRASFGSSKWRSPGGCSRSSSSGRQSMLPVESMLSMLTEALQKQEIALLLLVCSITTIIILTKKYTHAQRFPPGPFAWPLIGHLHYIADYPHRNLAALSKRYGPMLGLRLGPLIRAVAISSPELAKEVLATHDKVFANRPAYDFTSVLLFGFANDMIFGPPGPQWRKQRKLCFMSLLTAKRLQQLEHIRQEEIASLLLLFHQAAASTGKGTAAATPIDMGDTVGHMSTRIIMRLLASKASLVLGGENVRDIITDLEHEVSFPTVGDLFPYLSFLDIRRKQQMRRIHDRVDRAVSAMIAERRKSTSTHDDFLQAILSKEVGYDPALPPEETFTPEEIKGIVLNVLAAGVNTTSLTIEWAMAELLKKPQYVQRLREEIDTQLGKKRQITDADISKLSFLKCVVKEVFRLHPAIPLLVPRISNAECVVNGYTLPVNTQVFVNVWAIQRDETLWEHANDFMPQRFEGRDTDVKGQNFELLPFGSGRRVCVGVPLALLVVEATIANLVNSFDWELPNGAPHTSISLEEKSGMSANKATPLMVIPKPRISIL